MKFEYLEKNTKLLIFSKNRYKLAFIQLPAQFNLMMKFNVGTFKI